VVGVLDQVPVVGEATLRDLVAEAKANERGQLRPGLGLPGGGALKSLRTEFDRYPSATLPLAANFGDAVSQGAAESAASPPRC
jgi:hypothetical protein